MYAHTKGAGFIDFDLSTKSRIREKETNDHPNVEQHKSEVNLMRKNNERPATESVYTYLPMECWPVKKGNPKKDENPFAGGGMTRKGRRETPCKSLCLT